jgi:LemA family
MRKLFSGIIITCCGIVTMNCTKQQPTSQEPTFTRQDSANDFYLAYQDSILQSWNVMISDDNQKINSMRNLLHELMVSNPDQREEFLEFDERLDNLIALRYDQKSIASKDTVEEYDFASNSLVSELLSMAEAQPEFAYNATLQTLAEEIRLADQRVSNYREDYDAIVTSYNLFLEHNQQYLTDIGTDSSMLEKKPRFQMVSEEIPQ